MPKPTCNKSDWNHIDLIKIKNNDQKEITDLYYKIKPYFLFFFNNDEDLFQELFLRILSKIHLYDPKKGLFSNWIHTMAKNKRTEAFQQKEKEKTYILSQQKVRINNTSECYDYSVSENIIEGIDYENWSAEQKIELELLIHRLSQSEKEFLEWYITTSDEKVVRYRMKYYRIMNKLKGFHS